MEKYLRREGHASYIWYVINLATVNALSEGAVESEMAIQFLAIKYFTFFPPHKWVMQLFYILIKFFSFCINIVSSFFWLPFLTIQIVYKLKSSSFVLAAENILGEGAVNFARTGWDGIGCDDVRGLRYSQYHTKPTVNSKKNCHSACTFIYGGVSWHSD